jgi:hypothetical protein
MNLPTDYHETMERNRAAIERVDELLAESYCYRCNRKECSCGIWRNCSPFPPLSVNPKPKDEPCGV